MSEKDIKIWWKNSNTYLKYVSDGVYELVTDGIITKFPSTIKTGDKHMQSLMINGNGRIYVGYHVRQFSVKEIIEKEEGKFLIVF